MGGEVSQSTPKNQLFCKKKKIVLIYMCILQSETAAGILSCALHSPHYQDVFQKKTPLNLPFLG